MFLLFSVPNPVVQITSTDALEYGKTATLKCSVIAVRGITSRVDIIWLTGYNYTILKTVDNVTANIINNSAVYIDHLTTPPLGVNDNGRVYYCIMNISTTTRLNGFAGFTLKFTGKQLCFTTCNSAIYDCSYLCTMYNLLR